MSRAAAKGLGQGAAAQGSRSAGEAAAVGRGRSAATEAASSPSTGVMHARACSQWSPIQNAITVFVLKYFQNLFIYSCINLMLSYIMW